MRSVFVVSNDKEIIRIVGTSIRSHCHVDAVYGDKDPIEQIRKKHYDLAFIDLDLLLRICPGNGCNKAPKPLKALFPSMEIIVMSPQERIREAVNAVKAGADDYLTYPINPDEVRLVVESLEASILDRSELAYLRDKFWKSDDLDIVQTRNSNMLEIFKKIRSVGPTKTTVLLVGETGTGKGVLSKLIHRHSHRAAGKFISVHCGAIPETLLESELFGHEKGAFTGAVRRKLGKFEIARDGTIFLDEIGTITPSAQIKLLQVLQDGSFNRVGGDDAIETNARVIAATNSDLKKMTEEGFFRKDLYYRLNVFPIELPPLRDRIEDIPILVESFLKRLNRDFQKNIFEIHPLVLEAFRRYAWPGNIREMENLMERAYILESSATLTPESFPRDLFDAKEIGGSLQVNTQLNLAAARRQAVDDFERHYLKALLARNKGRMNKSAEEAAISTRQLHKLMLRYGIRKEEFKA